MAKGWLARLIIEFSWASDEAASKKMFWHKMGIYATRWNVFNGQEYSRIFFNTKGNSEDLSHTALWTIVVQTISFGHRPNH